MDMILPFFDYLPTSTWTFFTLNMDKNRHFLTTYPSLLVHVVTERPLVETFPITLSKVDMNVLVSLVSTKI